MLKGIWTNDFCINQKTHRKNDGFWSAHNLNEIIECNDKNYLKVMIFATIVDGKVSIVHAFNNENGRRESMKGESYLKLLQETILPTFSSFAIRKGLWWLQDGAPVYCTTAAKEILLKKFRSRVNSRRTDVAWPAYSPDLNPLDFHY